MAKKELNIFKTSDSIAAEARTRKSDKSIVQRAKEQANSNRQEKEAPKKESRVEAATTNTPARKPVKKKAAPKKRYKTTIDVDDEILQLKTNLIYTIRSSGKAEILPAGDYSVKERDFWLFAIEAAAEKAKKIYGEIKSAPGA
jgi:hypothetical protein